MRIPGSLFKRKDNNKIIKFFVSKTTYIHVYISHNQSFYTLRDNLTRAFIKKHQELC